MRKLAIYWLFCTLSVKKQFELISKLSKTAYRKQEISRIKGNKRSYPKNRKHGPRGPYKKKIEPMKIEVTKPVFERLYDSPKFHSTSYNRNIAEKIMKLNVGDNVWFDKPITNISPIVSELGKRNSRTFKGSTIGPNRCEYVRTQ